MSYSHKKDKKKNNDKTHDKYDPYWYKSINENDNDSTSDKYNDKHNDKQHDNQNNKYNDNKYNDKKHDKQHDNKNNRKNNKCETSTSSCSSPSSPSKCSSNDSNTSKYPPFKCKLNKYIPPKCNPNEYIPPKCNPSDCTTNDCISNDCTSNNDNKCSENVDLGCCKKILISCKDINRCKPYIITKPGCYALKENLFWRPRNNRSIAIEIKSDFVTLDLCGHVIRQVRFPRSDYLGDFCKTPGNVASGNVGIQMTGTSITIKNGTVSNIQGAGIVARKVSDLNINDITVIECGKNGVINSMMGARNGGIFILGDRNCKSSGLTEVREYSKNITLNNVQCINNNSCLKETILDGCLFLFCQCVRVFNSTFNQNFNDGPASNGCPFTVVGLEISVCNDVVIENCDAHKNNGTVEVAGFFAWGQNLSFNNCRAHDNYTFIGRRAAGFNISYSENVICNGCQAHRNFVKNKNAGNQSFCDCNCENINNFDFSGVGFRIGGDTQRAILKCCQANGNWSVSQLSPAAGFMLNACGHCVFENCQALANYNTCGKVAGFYSRPESNPSSPDAINQIDSNTNNEFINCTANFQNWEQPRQPCGPSNLSCQSLLERPTINETCGDTPETTYGRVAGFWAENQKNVKFLNCNAEWNRGYGIYLQRSSSYTENISCYIIGNNTLANNKFYGFYINNAGNGPALGAYYSNSASFNGSELTPIPTFNGNYGGDLSDGGASVVSWDVTGPPPVGINSRLDNMSLYKN
jgi:hypothetical protein